MGTALRAAGTAAEVAEYAGTWAHARGDSLTLELECVKNVVDVHRDSVENRNFDTAVHHN